MLRPVDMGLPSGLLWSPVDLDYTKPGNVCESPFVYTKSFFSWGNIQGHNPLPNSNSFAYDFGSINSQAPWFDGQVYGTTPGASLEGDVPLSMDAAHVYLGTPWRMPTSDNFKELFDNCDFVQSDGITVIDASTTDKRVTVNGVVGIYLRSIINGNHLFFACSGAANGSSWRDHGVNGNYWSVSFTSEREARSLNYNPSGINPQGNYGRMSGFAVRPVYDPSLL